MKITYHDWRSAEPTTVSVERYVEDALRNGQGYETRGVAEEAGARASRCAEAIGKLCEILADKGVLNATQIPEIAGIYTGTDKKKPVFAP